jgi:hypothetical protein
VIRFVDIGGIDDHQCLNFLFIKNNETLFNVNEQIFSYITARTSSICPIKNA